ncbi:MAG: DUF4230 domain-containing protein [Synergistaceae bacterium]|nr:DUF4230 domain-containing protein [Synergistaceae bacterium]
MTASVMLVLLTVIAISVFLNVYLLKRRRSLAKARDITSVLMQGLQEVSELATIRQSFQSIVMYEDFRSLFGFHLPGTHKKFILKYSGSIVVGTDLSKANVTQFVSGKVKIALPHSRILDVTADMKSINVYDQHSGIFNPLCFDEQNRAIAANLLEIEAEARSGEILSRSNENAKNILESVCRDIGIGVEVEFIGEPALPEPKSVYGALPENLPSERSFVTEDLPVENVKL